MTPATPAVTPYLSHEVQISRAIWLEMLAEAWDRYPEEACGVLVAAGPDAPIERFVPIPNAERSSRVFSLHPLAYDRADRAAEADGLAIVGVVHSHTHTAAFPSPTDREQMRNPLISPDWHWVIISLGWSLPEVRSFRVSENSETGIGEERVVLAQ